MKGRQTLWKILIPVSLGTSLLFGLYQYRYAQTPAGTLSPNHFADQTREAYQAAAEVPKILAEITCPCGCKAEFDHESLLVCFKTAHAAT